LSRNESQMGQVMIESWCLGRYAFK